MSKDNTGRKLASRKLMLKRETITSLTGDDLDGVHGGTSTISASISLFSIVTFAVCVPVTIIISELCGAEAKGAGAAPGAAAPKGAGRPPGK